MTYFLSRIVRQFSVLVWMAIAVFTLSGVSPASAEATLPALPQEFGQVVYQKHGERPNQIFIIGQSHRSSLTGANGDRTVQAQREIYRIGEWLIEEEGVRLLLPEGYFQRRPGVAPASAEEGALRLMSTTRMDDETLTSKLSDTRTFVNADILLKDTFNIRLQQVEEKSIYESVGKVMRTLQQFQGFGVPLGAGEELEYLQQLRTAAMIQNIPSAVEREFQAGTISSQRAMFTIGMAHLDEMIRYFDEERILVPSPENLDRDYEDFESVVDLLDAGYGVTVILPRSLAEDSDALKMVSLDTI